MSKKEKAKARLARQLEEAKRIHFQTLAPIKKKFWRDTQKNLTEEDHRNLRIKIKAKVDKSLDSQVVPRPIMSFDDPDLPASMKKYLAFLTNKYPDITRPTPVQSQCWPSILSGEDILSIAQTGSGKTLGYLLPCIPNIIAQLNIRKEGRLKKLEEQKKNPSILKKSNQGPVVLIIVPTRELAKQVESSCKPLKSKFNIHSIAIYGGVDAQEQKEILGQEHNEIIIATPGRLVDLIQRSKEVVGLLGGVSMLIFDEADRMLQLGFGDQLQKISEQIRPDRQTLMFSATFPHAMQEASTKWLKAPLKIRVKSSSANQESTAIVSKNVKQVAKVIQEKDRTEYLSKFITSIMDRELCLRNRSLILIFVNTIRSVKPLLTAMEKVASAYTKRKYKVGAIHGDMKQNERDDVISDFKSGKISILVATDILGRGIHIGGLRFVINYDFPTSLEQYIHRVGRTGRQGNKGHALTFFTQIVQNLPMAKGLIRILEECGQQVSTELRAIADSHQGTLDNIEFEKLAQLLKGEEDPFGSDEEDIMEQDDDSEFDSNDEDEYSNDEQEDDD
ncbi:hypothetical protein CYY_000421 [Polysphondylium violaceum]|nr:hypothetical protein CYY_000421 [Polysphondylium violaceum]